MNQQEISYCEICARKLLKEWKGWPHKDAVPLLPQIVSGACNQCGNVTTTPLLNSKIAWLNYHSEGNTGLPDYWLLAIDSHSINPIFCIDSDLQTSKWGHPYFAEGNCPKCKQPSIISEMKYPDTTHELMYNCKKCGLQKIPGGKY